MVSQDLSAELLQRLLTRLDHIEYRLVKDQQHEVSLVNEQLSDLRESVDDMVEAKRLEEADLLEAQDIAIADFHAYAPRVVPSAPPPTFGGGHRGPGSEPPRAASVTAGVSPDQASQAVR